MAKASASCWRIPLLSRNPLSGHLRGNHALTLKQIHKTILKDWNFVKKQSWKIVATNLLFDPQWTIVFHDDGVALVHGHEPIARVNGQHRESHAEIWRQDPVPAKTLDFVVVGAGEINEPGEADRSTSQRDLDPWRRSSDGGSGISGAPSFIILQRRSSHWRQNLQQLADELKSGIVNNPLTIPSYLGSFCAQRHNVLY